MELTYSEKITYSAVLFIIALVSVAMLGQGGLIDDPIALVWNFLLDLAKSGV